jgi:hypothetical protein
LFRSKRGYINASNATSFQVRPKKCVNKELLVGCGGLSLEILFSDHTCEWLFLKPEIGCFFESFNNK